MPPRTRGPSWATSTSCGPATTAPNGGSPTRWANAGELRLGGRQSLHLPRIRGERPRPTITRRPACSLTRSPCPKAAREPRRQAFGLSMLGRMDLLRGDLDSAGTAPRQVHPARRSRPLAVLPALATSPRGARPPCGRERPAGRTRAGPGPSHVPARSATPAGKARRPADSHWSPKLEATSTWPSRRSRTRARAPTGWPTRTSGSTATSSTPNCDIGRRHGHRNTNVWVESMRLLASRCGMRELTVRALIHSGALGNAGDAQAAALFASDIDSEP